MQVKQIYELMNTVTRESLGLEVDVQEDLSNIVEVINTQEDNNYTRKFILYEEPVKDFFKDLIEETNFLDLYLGIIFTDPILIENFLKNEDNDNNDFF